MCEILQKTLEYYRVMAKNEENKLLKNHYLKQAKKIELRLMAKGLTPTSPNWENSIESQLVRD